MSFGLSNAPEAFRIRMNEIVEDLERVDVFLDDAMSIYDKTLEELNYRLEKFLQKAVQHLKIRKNRRKLQTGHGKKQANRCFTKLKGLITESHILHIPNTCCWSA